MKSAPLSEKAASLLEILLDAIESEKIVVGQPNTFIGYKDCLDEMGIAHSKYFPGRKLQTHGLNELAEWTRNNNLPCITGLIVEKKTLRPGQGFFNEFNEGRQDLNWWMNETKRSVLFDWSKFGVARQEGASGQDLRELFGKQAEGKLGSVRARVRQRCQRTLKTARQYYRVDGKLVCEVCEWTMPEEGFSREIIQMHHRVPLSDFPRSGKSLPMEQAVKNLVPLCPTCHAMIHAKPRGGVYSVKELRELLRGGRMAVTRE